MILSVGAAGLKKQREQTWTDLTFDQMKPSSWKTIPLLVVMKCEFVPYQNDEEKVRR